jgi:hypothetical protein
MKMPWRLTIVALLAVIPVGCAARIGRNAAAGAMAEMRQQSANGGPPPARVAAENAVAGALAALDTPEQQARIQRLVSQAAAGALAALETPEQQARMQRLVLQTVAAVTRSVVEDSSAELSRAVAAVTRSAVDEASAELTAQLGPNGSGPLGVGMMQVGERLSASVAKGAVGGMNDQLTALLPECTGPNRAACLEQRLQQTTRTTAATFTKGVRDSIGWQLLFVAFVLGASGGALGSWLWSLRQVRRSWRTA